MSKEKIILKILLLKPRFWQSKLFKTSIRSILYTSFWCIFLWKLGESSTTLCLKGKLIKNIRKRD